MPSSRSRIAVLLLAGWVSACTAETPTVAPGPWNTFADRPCDAQSEVAYEDFGGPFMLTWCRGCHASDLPADMRQGATVGVDFDTIDDIRAEADRIWARAGDHNETMPPIGGPDPDERALLGEWLACGAPTFDDD